MTISKTIFEIIGIAVITTILLIPQGLAPNSFADITGVGDPHRHFIDLKLPEDPNYVMDTVGDVKMSCFSFQ